MKSRWFEIWFDTNYHDLLYQHRDEEEAKAFVEPLFEYLKLVPGATVLDAACGRGMHANLIADKGFEVTGIDLSWKNIREARKTENNLLSFYVHDIRHLFRINYFDAILNIYTSFGYFEKEEDNLQVIKSFASGLKRGGKLIIDFFNADYIASHLPKSEAKTINGISFTISKDIRDRKLLKEIFINDHGKEKTFYEEVNCYSPEIFQTYFAKCGLKLIDLFGNYALQPFDPKNSERMILISEKQ